MLLHFFKLIFVILQFYLIIIIINTLVVCSTWFYRSCTFCYLPIAVNGAGITRVEEMAYFRVTR